MLLVCRGGSSVGASAKQAHSLHIADTAVGQEPTGGQQGHAQVLGSRVRGDLPGRFIHVLHH